MDFSQHKDMGETKGVKTSGYPIKILVLEKKSESDVADNYSDYNLLYDNREVVFLDKTEVFRDRGRNGLNVLEKIDYMFVLLTEALLNDYNMMRILMANYNEPGKNKIKPIIKENSLRQHTTRIKIYEKMIEDMEELRTSNIINKDIQRTYEEIGKIYDTLDEFLTYALDMDIWEDVSIPDKITNYLREDDKKILYKKEKNKRENGEDGCEKKYALNHSKKIDENAGMERPIYTDVYISMSDMKKEIQMNDANGNGIINGTQNNTNVSNG